MSASLSLIRKQLFFNKLEIILKNQDKLLVIPELSEYKLNGIAVISGIGGYVLTLGNLINLWKTSPLWKITNYCPNLICSGKNLYLFSVVGSPLSGRNYCLGYCSKCKEIVEYSTPSFASIVEPAMALIRNNPLSTLPLRIDSDNSNLKSVLERVAKLV